MYPKATNNKYDLEDRSYNFARQIRQLVKSVKFSEYFYDDCRQLLRSSGSIAANYIEANEALGKQDS